MPPELVFIIAPTEKCGTNYLINVLVQIGFARLPNVDPLRREDHLLNNAHLLEQYARSTTDVWQRWEGYSTAEFDQARIISTIGEGLQQFIGVGGRPPIALKTPSSKNLHLGPVLFPNAAFLIIVRDGRDVTESGLLSNYWRTYEQAFIAWSDGMRKILRFIEGQQCETTNVRWAFIHFESLLSDPQTTLSSVATILEYPKQEFDVVALDSLPVYGSSDYGRSSEGAFTWKYATKTKDFIPIGRWRCWGDSTRDLFKSIAGEYLISLGYEEDDSW